MLGEGEMSTYSARLSLFCLLTSLKYGTVERVYIHRDSGDTAPVFVKFTSQLSALRVSISQWCSISYQFLITPRPSMLSRAGYLMATRSLRGFSIARSSKKEYTRSELDTMYYYALLMMFNGSVAAMMITSQLYLHCII